MKVLSNSCLSYQGHSFTLIVLLFFFTEGRLQAQRLGNAASTMASATYTARVFMGRGMVVPASELDFYRAAQDRDDDLLPDNWERRYFGNLVQTATGDTDNDNLDNAGEYAAGTVPNDSDSDDDDIPDGWELQHGLNPLAALDGLLDTDNDGILNIEEFKSNSDPTRYVIHLQTGWNLVSLGTQPQNHSIADVFGDLLTGVVWMWRDGRFEIATEIHPHRGYWVYVLDETEIEVELP